jgi:glycogen operon protein
MPKAAANLKWRLFIDTAAEAPDDIHPDADGPELTNEPVLLDGHTLRCYVAE